MIVLAQLLVGVSYSNNVNRDSKYNMFSSAHHLLFVTHFVYSMAETTNFD